VRAKLDHVSIVVEDLDEALIRYQEMLGLTLAGIGVIEDEKSGIRVGLLPIGENSLELIQPTDPDNRCAAFLRENGEGLFHVALFVDDYDNAVADLEERGFPVELTEEDAVPGTTVRLGWLVPKVTGGPHIALVDSNSTIDLG
jgi:methylmalonyl-CoA epimerase